MTDWNEGYFTDSTYTYGYYRELSPNFMRWCLLLKGIIAPEISEESCHCELGFGQGISANIHAAATPGRYFGTDFNPAHAAQAKDFADASGADANFFEDSFEEFSQRNLPQFDSIGLHGVWTWVSAENRQHILEIARKHLKSGGMFYNSYNCLPGWAPHSPLRELLLLYYRCKSDAGTNSDEQINSAINSVEEMIAAEPLYLNFAPNFKAQFELLKKHDTHYVAHEYLNLDWDLMYFKDVAELCQSAKLEFATSAVPLENRENIILNDKARDFLAKFGNPIMREQLQDYFINRQFRKDIYVRGVRRLSNTELYDKILSTRYVLLKPADAVPMKINAYQRELTLNAETYRPFLEYLAQDNFRPKDLKEYFLSGRARPEIILEMLTILVSAGHVMPCQSEAAVKQVKKSCEQLNAYIRERANFGNAINYLASPLTGCGVEVNRFHQIFLAQYKAGNKTSDKLADATWEIISRNGERMLDKDKKLLNTPEENLAQLKTLAEGFLSNLLPIYKALLLI